MSTRDNVRRLLALGMTNKQIAREVGVAPSTVKYHVAMIAAAVGARTRTQAALALNRV